MVAWLIERLLHKKCHLSTEVGIPLGACYYNGPAALDVFHMCIFGFLVIHWLTTYTCNTSIVEILKDIQIIAGDQKMTSHYGRSTLKKNLNELLFVVFHFKERSKS